MTHAVLFLSVTLAATGGAGSGDFAVRPAVRAVRVHGHSYVSVPALLRARSLRQEVDEKAGIYTLTGSGRRIVLAPGFGVAVVNGEAIELPAPAIFRDGQLMVPWELFAGRLGTGAGDIDLKKIVLDAGHGGRDSGAIGRGGLKEKTVALSVALRLKTLLEDRGVEVVMTRETDTFVSLRERSRIANSSGADLFLSIHCNACVSRRGQGIETFALSSAISDSYRAGKATERHRPSDLIDGAADRVSRTTEKTVFRAYLGEQRSQSLRLARKLQSEMVDALSETDRGVKYRNFAVLRETYVPAALAEVGFVSWPATERKMRTGEYRQDIAESLLAGLAGYASGEEAGLDRIAGRTGVEREDQPQLARRKAPQDEKIAVAEKPRRTTTSRAKEETPPEREHRWTLSATKRAKLAHVPGL